MQQEGSTAQEVGDVREDSTNNNTEHNPPSASSQTTQQRWQQLNQKLQNDILTFHEIGKETGNSIVENCQQWEAAVPQEKRWDAIANICGHNETLLDHLSGYAYDNHFQWHKNWGALLATYQSFEQEVEWVGISVRTDALITMGYKISVIVEVLKGNYQGKQGEIIELHGNNAAPVLVEFNDSQQYFHWHNLRIIEIEDIQEEEYSQKPKPGTESEPSLLDEAIDALVKGEWEDIRNIFNQYPQIKGKAWNHLSATQKQRVVDITPEIVKVLNQAKKDRVIQEYKDIAVGVYQIKLPNALLWEQRAYHEIEIRYYLQKRRESMARTKS